MGLYSTAKLNFYKSQILIAKERYYALQPSAAISETTYKQHANQLRILHGHQLRRQQLLSAHTPPSKSLVRKLVNKRLLLYNAVCLWCFECVWRGFGRELPVGALLHPGRRGNATAISNVARLTQLIAVVARRALPIFATTTQHIQTV
jgi:hypothetical protein